MNVCETGFNIWLHIGLAPYNYDHLRNMLQDILRDTKEIDTQQLNPGADSAALSSIDTRPLSTSTGRERVIRPTAVRVRIALIGSAYRS